MLFVSPLFCCIRSSWRAATVKTFRKNRLEADLRHPQLRRYVPAASRAAVILPTFASALRYEACEGVGLEQECLLQLYACGDAEAESELRDEIDERKRCTDCTPTDSLIGRVLLRTAILTLISRTLYGLPGLSASAHLNLSQI